MILTILTSVTILTILSDVYLWHRIARHWHTPLRYLHWLPLALLGMLLVLFLLGTGFSLIFTLGIYLFLLVCLPAWIHALLALLRMPRIGGIVRLALILVSLYGITLGWKHLVTRDVNITSSSLPLSFNGYRIAQISDLHIGTYVNSPEMVDEIVRMVNETRPNLIVFTGDIVSISPEELRPFVNVLSQLKAPDGVLSIMGNHDYCTYAHGKTNEEKLALQQEVVRMQKEMGWHLLMNEHLIIYNGQDSIAIIGVENDGHPPFPARANLGKAMSGINDNCFKILLSHDPSHWRRAILGNTNIDLTLSGHTHAMHLRIGNWSPSSFIYPEWGGLYTEGTQHLHVNTGTGSNIPFRLGAWPEISLITLTSASER